MLPDEPAITKTFDYLVPPHLADGIVVGTIVRVALHGRRVRGWVVAVGVEPPADVKLRPIAKVTGAGPPADIVDLARWAAWRWAGRPAHFLRTASPPTAVPLQTGVAQFEMSNSATPVGPRVVRMPPSFDPFPVVMDATRRGNALVLVPSFDAARLYARRLRAAGVTVAAHPKDWARGAAGATVVGTRAAAWAPVGNLAAVVVIDEHDEGHRQEQAPTWHARDVALERARRAGVPCALTSPCPTLEALAAAPLESPSTRDERSGWPPLDIVDRRGEDPLRAGLYSERLVRLLRDRDRGRALCVLNRTGRARLLACVACGELARCENPACGGSMALPEAGTLRCRRCQSERPVVCTECGAAGMKNLRAGVSRVREELAALTGEPVLEVTASTPRLETAPRERVLVGTEAVLHQAATLGDVGVVAFLDFDQELLAPRYRAHEQAFVLLARAARLLGGRLDPRRRLVVQTRLPRHAVLSAALHANPDRLVEAERERRQALRYPPYAALALAGGVAAPPFVAALDGQLGLEALGPDDSGRWLLRAPDHRSLCDALAATPRPSGRLRVEVDPLRM